MRPQSRLLRWSFLCLPLLAGSISPTPCVAETNEAVFPFVLPWDDASPGITDMSDLLAKPAGKAGHLRVGGDGHFYAGAQRQRFFGVNLSFTGGMPRKSDGEKVAARLAKFGINVARFHHMDTSAWPGGIRARPQKGTGELEPEALDRMFYFINQLKQHGIYANINLLVGRPFNAGDGLPAEIEKLGWKERHIPGFFNAKHVELQKVFARKLLTTRNPYTGLTLVEDPAVAFVEINNENGLIHSWLARDVDDLPVVFRDELAVQWNQWLKQRHGSSAQLREAWGIGAEPAGTESFANAGFARQLDKWIVERHAGAQVKSAVLNEVPPGLRSADAAARAVRIEVVQPGQESWHVQFNQGGLKLVANHAYTLTFWARANAARSINLTVGQAHDPWGNLGLGSSAAVTPEWKPFRLVFRASASDANARVSWAGFGGAGAWVELAGLSLKPGGVSGLKPGENLETASIGYFDRPSFGERTDEAQRDWMRFLQDTEDHYWQTMTAFLKDELKVKAPIAGTIVGCSPPNLMARLDWVDTHSYWQHPRFPNRPWDSEDWIVNNKSMVNERGGILPGLALKRVLGKPHACTEYNHAAPNTYSSEGFLLAAAYAALQDWDAIYIYAYAHGRNEGWDGRKITSFFDVDQHPTKMAALPATVAMFLRGDVSAAKQVVVAELSREREADLLRKSSAWSLVDAGHVGVPRETALVHRVGLVTQGRTAPAHAVKPESVNSKAARLVSDTGELTWDLSNQQRGVVTVNTPRSKAVIGFGGGGRFDLGGVVIEPGQGVQDGWSAITLTAKNPAGAPTRWLVTATGYAENTGMKWKSAEHSSVGRAWGAAPSRVEGVPATLTFAAPAASLEAWALDERGQRQEALKVNATADGRAMLQIGPAQKTLWYEVTAR